MCIMQCVIFASTYPIIHLFLHVNATFLTWWTIKVLGIIFISSGVS